MSRSYLRKEHLFHLEKPNMEMDCARLEVGGWSQTKRSTCSGTLGEKEEWTPRKKSHKLALHGVRHRLQAIVRVQFLVNMVQMVPQGLRRNSQLASNFR